MAANAAFTSVTKTDVVSRYNDGGKCMITGTAVGPNVAGADTVIDLSAFFTVVDTCKVTIPHDTAWYNAVYARASAGDPATGKVRIFSGTDAVAQSEANLSGITCSWVATGTIKNG
jgi:hypothetical protein